MPRELESIDALNEFLRSEMTASETYKIALDRLERGSKARAQLETARASHIQRVRKLQTRIRDLGGIPAQSGGAWGGISKTIEAVASLIGEKSAVAVLERSEDHGLQRYRDDVVRLKGLCHEFLVNNLLPSQVETHSLLSTLKHTLEGAA
jgi:bacterioferritin (cytochrome b1)